MDTACVGKRCYMSPRTARRAALVNQDKLRGRWSAYLCTSCPYYHIGHTISRNPSRGTILARRDLRAKQATSWVGLELCGAEVVNRLKVLMK